MKKLFSSIILGGIVLLNIAASEKKAPVVHLKFDEGTGNIAKDSSGNGLDAKLSNVTWEEFGIQGKAVKFNGKNSAVILPNHPALKLDKAMTLSVWFKMEGGGRGMNLFARGNYNIAWQAYVFRSFLMVSSKKMGSAVCYVPVKTGTGKMDPYHHAVYVVGPDPANPGKNLLRFYLDGRLLANKGVTEFPVSGKIPTNEKHVVTLGNFASYEAQWFHGIMDEVKIYDRALTDKEVKEEYKKTSEVPANMEVKKVALKKIAFPPLKKRRLAVFTPPAPISSWPVKDQKWFIQQGKKLGLQVTFLTEKQLCDKNFLSVKNFDTLFLATTTFPFEGEYTIPNFLAQGGNLITQRILPDVYRKDAKGKVELYSSWGNAYSKNHNRGWYAPFLLRENPTANGSRHCRSALALDPAIVNITGDLLPASFGPFPKLKYRPVNQWVLISGYDTDTGDDFNNYPLAGDVKVDLYKEYNGLGSDFVAYRYYNSYFFGSTMVNLGSVGMALLKGKDADKVMHAILRLLENPLPGELKKEDHKALVDLHKSWSDLGFVYTDCIASLRDAAYFAYTKGDKNWKKYVEEINRVEQSFDKLSGEIKNQRTLLVSEKRKESAKAAHLLLNKATNINNRWSNLKKQADAFCAAANVPAKMPVKHKYKTIPAIASFTVPVNLYRMREKLFDGIRRVGCDVYSSNPFPAWYVEDPVIRRKMDGIKRDHKFIYFAGARNVSHGGYFNPANGTVRDTPEIPYPEKAIRNILKTVFKQWKWKEKEEFRIGTGDEGGLGLSFWGKDAEKKLQKYLKKYYKNDISAMNKHCGTLYKSFEEIKVPLRQPVTPAQHAIWEHFRKYREGRLEYINRRFYELVKENNPDLDVFSLPSTGGSLMPQYGINFYNLTKYQDVSGIDGTTCAIDREWLFLDVTTKRYLTSEWGALYRRNPVQFVNGQAWQEFSGGALGLETFNWSFGNTNCNYADFLDHPTIYGALLARMIKDSRKVDYLLLDGERTVPEVGILFSQTAKSHDQGWGWAGRSTFSAHMHSVNVYYALFLQYGRSARVYAEEALLEGKMPQVKVLIVPQAEYLSAPVQKKLLEYVKKGGKIVVEGRLGKNDEFGRKSDLFYRETNIIPFFAGSRKVKMNNAILEIQKQDQIYSPAGKGNVLASYADGKPAILTTPYGKGSVTFLGFNPGLHRYACFAPVTERVMRSLGISERFRTSDKELVLREWTYNGDTFLILSSKAGKEGVHWGMNETEIAVRGKVKVIDYLFGKEIQSSYRNNYTVCKILMGNGGRILKIDGKIASPETAVKNTESFKLESISGNTDNFKTVSLPFKDHVYADTPLKAKDYVISATILGSSDKADVGNAFLTIRKGDEVQKKRMENGRTVYYRFREGILEVKCIKNFFMYPFYTILEIREVKSIPAAAGAKFEKKNGKIILSNDLVSLAFDGTKGAKLLSIMPLAEKEELIYPGERAWMVSNNMPGPFAGSRFDVKLFNDIKGANAFFSMKTPSQNRLLTQNVTLLPDAAAFRMNVKCTNTAKGKILYDLRFHPGLQLGGAADNNDAFFISSKDGNVREAFFRGQNTGAMWQDCGLWGAVVDTKEQVACITSAKEGQIGKFYTWEASSFYTLELYTPYGEVEAGKSRELDMTIQYMHGLTGVHAVNGLVASHLVLQNTIDQYKELDCVLELATSSNKITPWSFSASLWKNGKKQLDFLPGKGIFAFDLPDKRVLKAVKDLKGLPDGMYEIRINVKSANGNLSFSKNITFAGKKLAELSALSSSLEKSLEAKEKYRSSEKRFALLVKLGEMRNALTTYKLDLARKLAEELKKELK